MKSSTSNLTCAGKLCVIDKSAAIADFGVEHLACRKSLVGLDEIDDVVWHLVVASPWDVLHLIGDEYGAMSCSSLKTSDVLVVKAAALFIPGIGATDVGG